MEAKLALPEAEKRCQRATRCLHLLFMSAVEDEGRGQCSLLRSLKNAEGPLTCL